jgi:predicted ATPase
VAGIATPDQRLRVFVSSTLTELADERRAVRDAVTRLRLTPVMFELGARPYPPRDLYRSYLQQSDVFIGIYGERYGWVAPDMTISGLEDEFVLSTGMPRLLYLKDDAPNREPRLTELIGRMWAGGDTSTTPYRTADELGELVADDLAVLLSERFAEAAPAPPGLAAGWLPTPDAPLVDRAGERALIAGMLRDPAVRLVTVTGPGGTGKTRLALAVAQEFVPDRDAVYWVDLQPLRDPAAVPSAVAAAVGVVAEGSCPVLELVADRLAGRRVLLVVDNAEQVLGAAPDLGRLLSRCPGTQLLVTSRSLLGLRGEHDVPLGPLDVPPEWEFRPDVVRTSPAVELFAARARRADPAFAITERTAGPVAEVVRRLEGLPLALELVAARVRTLPPTVLLRRLGGELDPALDLRGPDVDAPDRQRSLRDAIAWSYDLLAEPERALLARLSVCAGGCALDTAEAIGTIDGDLDVLDTLSSLVGHSLVSTVDTGEGEPRFRMLQLVRAFAAERLRERDGEEEIVRERLADHFAAVSARAGARLSGPEHRLWKARLDAETVDVQAALTWAVDADRADLAVRIAGPLARWWWARGLLVQMGEIADRTAGLPSAAALPPAEAARLRWARGAARVVRGRRQEALPLFEQAVEDARAIDDPFVLGHGLVGLAMTRPPADPELASMLDDAVAALRRSGDTWSVAYALVPLGDLRLLAGDLPGAVRIHEEALELARGFDDDHLRATLHSQLGFDALMAGDVETARARLVEGAELHRVVHDQEALAYCLDGLAGLALVLGDAAAGARLAGAADAARRAIGVTIWPLLQPLADQHHAMLRAALGEEQERRERAAGAAAGPWAALEAGLATVSAAQPTTAG